MAIQDSKLELSVEGKSPITVEFKPDEVLIKDSDDKEISLNDKQAKWIQGVLIKHFGDEDNDLDRERLIFFTGDVDEKLVKDTQETLIRIAYKIKKKLSDNTTEDNNLFFFINTYGGSVHQGLALLDTMEHIRGLGINLTNIVTGTAYSMGSILLQGGDKRCIARHGRLMIHNISGISFGYLDELEADVKETRKVKEILAEILAERNTAGLNDPKYWMRKLNNNSGYFLNPKQAVEWGLADEVYNPIGR